MKIVLVALNAKYMHTSLGIRYLQRFCEADYDIEIMEFTINNALMDIVGQLIETKADMVGFSCCIWNIEQTKQIINMLKSVRSECIIVCGGPEVSYDTVDFMAECPAVDYVIRGEGEVLFKQLLDFLHEKNAVLDAKIARKLSDGRMQQGQAVVLDELEQLPFPYTLNELETIGEKILYYESTRGCPFSCQYCLSCATRGVRYLPLERVLAELAAFIKADVRQIKFVDRTFNASKRHYLPIWQFIAAQDCRTNFHFEIAADLLDDEAMKVLQTMPKGRIQLEIGIQSTYEPTLRAVQRKNDWVKLQHVISQLIGFGNIHVHVDLIIGLPYEGMEQFAKSFNEVYALQAHMVQVGFLKILKGSGLAEKVDEYGYVFMNRAPYQILATKYLSCEEVWRLHIFENIVELFYNSGRFSNATQLLIHLKNGNAFDFYMDFTEYWHSRGFHLLAHTTKALYTILYEYAKARYSSAKVKIVQELLKLDAMFTEQGKIKAKELCWNETLYVKETSHFLATEKAGKYIEGFRFSNWRELRKKYHIEVFGIDVALWLRDKRLIHAQQPVLFYTEAPEKYQVIEAADFWLEED